MILVLWGLSFFTFGLLYISPGDAAQKKLTAQGVAVTPEVLKKTREEMGLNRPFAEQYGNWLLSVLQGDLGSSYRDGRAVAEKLKEAFSNTLILTMSSLLIAVFLAILLGTVSALHKNKWLDRLLGVITFAGNSIPNFLLAVLLMYFFCIQWKLFPVLAKQSVQGLFLPTMALSVPLMCSLTRQIRAQVLEEMDKAHVEAAYARGVTKWRVLLGHVLWSSMGQILTMVGLSLGTLMGGSVVIEAFFGWPGLGKLAMDAITARDYPVVQGFVLLSGAVYVVINLVVDVLHRLMDPREEGAR